MEIAGLEDRITHISDLEDLGLSGFSDRYRNEDSNLGNIPSDTRLPQRIKEQGKKLSCSRHFRLPGVRRSTNLLKPKRVLKAIIIS